MKKYLIFSLFLSLFALNNAHAASYCVDTNDSHSVKTVHVPVKTVKYPTAAVQTVRYPATETTACYDTVAAVPCVPCDYVTYENSGMYVSLIGGANWLKNHHPRHDHVKLDMGYLAGGAIGCQFGNGMRLEAEVTYRHNRLKHKTEDLLGMHQHHVQLHSMSYMFNGLYDLNLDSDVTPYLGVGIGYSKQTSHHHKEDKTASFNKDGLAWQAIGGISYAVDAKTSLAVEYRYLDNKHHTHSHGANLAIRRMF